MVLNYPNFKIDLESFKKWLDINVSSSDGIVASVDSFEIIEKTPFIQTDIDLINTYYNSFTQSGENTKLQGNIYLKIAINAIVFGQNLKLNFISNNIKNGITQAGLTAAVSTYVADLSYALDSGSLYEAITIIESLKTNVPSNLSPFVTVDILNSYETQLKSYLGIV